MLKLIKSGIASAKAKNMEPAKLRIKELRVDEGKRLKRWLPAPRGRSYNIRKPTSHITLTLTDEASKGNKNGQ
jgi:large subunit ribosomal protein L22